MNQLPERQTRTIPEFSKILGISRNSGYEMAARGDVRTIRCGKKMLVPIREIERLLSGEQR